MEKYSKDGLEWLEFDLLADIPGLKHAVFLRHGGISKEPYESLNLSYDVGDDPKNVDFNIAKIKSFLQEGVKESIDLYWAKQSHATQIACIDRQSSQESVGFDALVTATLYTGLMVKHADCQSALFYDPINRVIGNVHAGWRGSVLNIYGEIIQYMQKQFGTKPGDLLVCISPSLGPDDAEFIHYSHELPEEFWPFQVRSTYFDFWAISEYQLQQSGILPHHIEIARISTYSNSMDYFSYRRHKITGRHGTCVMLYPSSEDG